MSLQSSQDGPRRRPNIVFIMSDDHAAHAIGAYGSKINTTPSLDRLASEGMRMDNCFCTNAICAPSRATILTGTHTHINGVQTLFSEYDSSQVSFPALLQGSGYRTGMIGKWHLGHGPGHDPVGFDTWQVLRGQGPYNDPTMLTPDGEVPMEGYVTDVITELGVDFIEEAEAEQPFCLMLHHKAPHRPWVPAERHRDLYTHMEIAEPDTLRDDYATRPAAAATTVQMRDLVETDLKAPVPAGLSEDDELIWRYQRYIADYVRCVAAVDEGVGRILDALDQKGLTENTIVIYTSDQGFFLGDHGLFDKRFIYEHSLRMPFLVRYPAEIAAGSTSDAIVTNVDFAETFCDWAGVAVPDRMQGRSFRDVLRGATPEDWPSSMYYRYWEHGDKHTGIWAHYGVRTHTHKLIYFYKKGYGLPGTSEPDAGKPYWELFDLTADPDELTNVYGRPGYEQITTELTAELARLQAELGDTTDAVQESARHLHPRD